MPDYDYRCNDCGARFTLHYKTYADYDAARKTCPTCGSDALARLIHRVSIKQPSRDYRRMGSSEMLSVLESGDSRQVGEMFSQIGGTDPALGKQAQETTERLLKGESKASIERDLKASGQGSKGD